MQKKAEEQPFQTPPPRRMGWWGWTGFGKKTLWDWLQLLVVPAVLVLGGLLLTQAVTQAQNERQRAVEEQRAQDAALQAYLDEMGRMLIDEDLLGSEEGDNLRTLARAHTLTVLERLDGEHKGRVLQFLSESGLISKGDPVVALEKANLTEVSWVNASLKDTDLKGAVMDYAYLPDADLRRSDLRQPSPVPESFTTSSGEDPRDVIDDSLRTDLSGADLRGANLRGALLDGTILTDADLSRYGPQPADLSNAELQRATLGRANPARCHSHRGAVKYHMADERCYLARWLHARLTRSNQKERSCSGPLLCLWAWGFPRRP